VDHSSTLEAFIEKLHTEGIEAGLHDAEQLRAAAAVEGAEVVEQARETGQKIIAQAEAEGRAILAAARSELAMAVRDAQLELRARLEQALTSLLKEGVRRELEDPTLMRRLLTEVVGAYARADAAAGEQQRLTIDVRTGLAEELTAAAPALLGKAMAEATDLDVKGGLGSAGFEYRVRGAVVEVTPESVAEKLAELVSPHLRSLLRSAADEQSEVAR
jgi:V/A-type H+-transporting ATPase subunit E